MFWTFSRSPWPPRGAPRLPSPNFGSARGGRTMIHLLAFVAKALLLLALVAYIASVV